MNSPISFTIDMNPIPKGRPRFGNGHAYTPPRTKAYEEYVGFIASAAMQGGCFETEQLALTLEFRRKGKRLTDIDNLLKAFMDAGNGIIWKDDTQVRRVTMQISYGHPTGETLVSIEAIAAS